MSRFAVIHSEWIEHSEVGADELSVLTVLALHADRDGTCFPSQGLIARLLGRSRPWVNKVIARLAVAGLVVKTNQSRNDGGERSCLYRLVPPKVRQDNPASPPTEMSVHSGNDAASPDGNRACHDGDSITPDNFNKQETPPPDVRVNLSTPPENWQPSDQDLIWALERYPGVDLQKVTDRFISRCRAKGYRYRNLGEAWRSWLADDALRAASNPSAAAKGKVPSAYSRYAAWSSVAANIEGEHRHAA